MEWNELNRGRRFDQDFFISVVPLHWKGLNRKCHADQPQVIHIIKYLIVDNLT